MKRYILIQNDGEVELGAFELIGASTKRGDDTKIGWFGSGANYSFAYLLRNNIDFKIFSGENEIVITTQPVMLREQEFSRVLINGKETSYTTAMGPSWTEDWFVIRELYCNAVDETNPQIVLHMEDLNRVAGKTRIYIEQTEKMTNIISNWDTYFSTDREPFFTAEHVYTSYLCHGAHSYQNVKVYHRSTGVIYRKGIRVHTNEKYLYDYEVEYATVNEDRTLKDPDALDYAISNMALRFDNEQYIRSIMDAHNEGITNSREYRALDSCPSGADVSEKWIDFAERCLLVLHDISARFAKEISESRVPVCMLPYSFASRIKKTYPDIRILGLDSVVNNESMSNVQPTAKMSYLLTDVIKILEEMKYFINYPIHITDFHNKHRLGMADMKAKEIYLSHMLFEKGRREIALCLIEENEHLRSEERDETREFQTHIFNCWLSEMGSRQRYISIISKLPMY